MLYPPSTVWQSWCKEIDIFIQSYLSNDPPVCLATRKSAICDQYRFCLSAMFSSIPKLQSCLTGSIGVAGQWFSSHIPWNLVCTCSQWCYQCELKIIKPSDSLYKRHISNHVLPCLQGFVKYNSVCSVWAQNFLICAKCQDSIVSMVSRIWNELSMVVILAGTSDFFLSKTSILSLGPTSLLFAGYKGSFPERKAAGAGGEQRTSV